MQHRHAPALLDQDSCWLVRGCVRACEEDTFKQSSPASVPIRENEALVHGVTDQGGGVMQGWHSANWAGWFGKS